ncbi:hypothetical protein BVRB_7g180580 [Beta vulgaris subsp. vulgaris]|uniref:Uncharacterized protein n=1 Tax=Beta vulgaris subsp. vulgaris TaxID=3555 RepID=A0A0J8E1B4_BETVV|nr:hypothetical protein BVRB_7g180580 [Beta vulgaris subsp. vulgaris]
MKSTTQPLLNINILIHNNDDSAPSVSHYHTNNYYSTSKIINNYSLFNGMKSISEEEQILSTDRGGVVAAPIAQQHR